MITKTDLFRLWAIAFRETLWKKYLPELVATLFLVFLVSYGVISYKLGFILIVLHRFIQILVDCTEKALRILATFMNFLEKLWRRILQMGIKRELKILAIGTYKILEFFWLLFLIFGAVPYFQYGKIFWLKVVIG